MRSFNFKSGLIKSGLAASALLLVSGAAFGQVVVNLTAKATTAVLPDGSNVPMWGLFCNDAGSPAGSCATLRPPPAAWAVSAAYTVGQVVVDSNGNVQQVTIAGTSGSSPPAAWGTTTGSTTVDGSVTWTFVGTLAAFQASSATFAPPVITVPTGQSLTINLTNGLSFTSGAGVNTVPTSLTIVGQLGGGLGVVGSTCRASGSTSAGSTCAASPDHTNAQPATWPIAGDPPGQPLTGVGTPPAQGARVQSFATEVAAGTTTPLTWTAPRPGTYLIESGTHPSIQGPMGLYGMLVVTCAPGATACATPGTAYPGVTYGADIPLLMSEIDPVQNSAVASAVGTANFAESNVWAGFSATDNLTVLCRAASATATSPTLNGACYPPAVNYTPLYYLINGRAFDKTNPSASLFAASPATGVAATSTVLVRLVNAGLRMHVPSIVGAQTGTATPAPAGFSLVAEDGNALPGVPRVQSEVFMPAGKTEDVMINVPAGTALPIFDRELSLSGNAIARDAGMQAYISVNGATLPITGAFAAASTTARANPDTYNSVIAGQTLTVSDPGKGLIANDINISGVHVVGTAPGGLTLNPDGTFTYTAGTPTTFTYCGNGATSGAACAPVTLGAAPIEAGTGITVVNSSYNANGTFLKIQPPGILMLDKDNAGYPLTVAMSTGNAPVPAAGLTLSVDANGGFSASIPVTSCTAPATTCPFMFTYKAQNSQGTVSNTTATVTVNFTPATNLAVTVLDGKDALARKTNPAITVTQITDYRWIIEEDRTFFIDPNCTANPPPAGCPTAASGIVPTFGTNFHTSYMPVIASGCTGPQSCEGGQTIFDPVSDTHVNAVCDQGDGVCRPDTTGTPDPITGVIPVGGGNGFAPQLPNTVHLDPTKRYYLTVFPGDAGNDFSNGNLGPECSAGAASAAAAGFDTTQCGHGMSGAPLACTVPAGSAAGTACTFGSVTVLTQPAPYPTAKLSVFVFQDDFPLNGEHDGGGGIDVLATNEPGLGGFNIILFDDAGGTGDATGQMSYDMFNQPLVNSLAGQIDPATGFDACPVSVGSRTGTVPVDSNNPTGPQTYDTTQTGITGMIVTCPQFESDGITLSPLAGQAVIANLMPGRYGVVATPAADRIARGEEWLQTNTLDGQKAHDSFLRIGEPSFFQEFGPAGYHVSIGFANPKIINDRKAGVCAGTDPSITGTNCTNTITGTVTTERMSRPPDERLYSSGDNSSFAFTQCFVSFGDTDGEDFAFTKCDSNGSFTLSGLPDGDWRITVFDQWNDMLVDGLSTPVRLAGGASINVGQIAMNQWQANIYTSSFFDANGNGVFDPGETGLTLVPTNIRFRDGSYSNFNNTDLAGNAGFNEVFPLFSWYVIESDSTRYKNTGTHVVYDAGGPADDSGMCGGTTGNSPCAPSPHTISTLKANSYEAVPVPGALHVPGAVYCNNADCSGQSIASPSPVTSTPHSSGRIDPSWVLSEGWQGFSGQNSFIEFGKRPFAAGENGGIHGEVIYASTRPFDDPQLLLHTSWTPDVPGVTINLYQVGFASDGVTPTLKLVDTTQTSSWDAWAQGFYPGTNKPYMNCPGQMPAPTSTTPGAPGDLFFFSLFNQPMYLDFYNSQHGGPAPTTVPNNSQFKCYDGMHNWNQVQPAPYDGYYTFPSIVNRSSTTGLPANLPGATTNPSGTGTPGSMIGTNCTICTPDQAVLPDGRIDNSPMLPPGQYVVEMIVPPGYELVKEEDKNILIGDNYIAPVTQEFPGLGSAIYILPDQASVAAVYNANQPGSVSGFNAANAQNPTQAFGRVSSLPSHEGDTGSVESFWPCVGATRIVPDYISLFPQSHEVAPFAGARRNLCDRKLVQLDDQTSALAKFWVFTSAHVAAHFTGVITDDFTSEFDPFSPQFGEKFSPANLPVALKDYTGQEISRVYADHWGTYDGLTYSTWEVNPPNPTGYAPTMMVTCMNDPGTGATPDPLFNPAYSQFCYEIPFMPGQTQYMDTPVVPTSAFAGAGYNNPDCALPDTTPAIGEVDGDGIGPWVATASGHTLTIYTVNGKNPPAGVTAGDETVQNYAYSGPAASATPFNQKTVVRHYGFGTTKGSVSIGTINLASQDITTWDNTHIVVNVPTGLPDCSVQQQSLYSGGAPSAQCGELVVTTSTGKRSVDAVTVTIGGKTPTHVDQSTGTPTGPTVFSTIQAAIDAANPGDLIIVNPGIYAEILLMWKPVRLQGAGATSTVIDANPHPAGKLDPWRAHVNCLFGLALNGQPMNEGGDLTFNDGSQPIKHNPYDATGAQTCPAAGWTNFSGGTNNAQVDRLPLQGILGWDTTVNGNLAELLQEPSLMGAYEGAGITVLAKGVLQPPNTNQFGNALDNTAGSVIAHEGQFQAPTVELTAVPAATTTITISGTPVPNTAVGAHYCTRTPPGGTTVNPYPSNFACNPSRIDGLSITNSSQGGGGIYVHGWAHNLEIANNEIYNNTGTTSGGINVGQGESPDALLNGNGGDPIGFNGGTLGGFDQQPWTCLPGSVVPLAASPIGFDENVSPPGTVTDQQLPYCYNINVNVHHNMVTRNSSIGDELFSATPAGAGGVSFCTGADYYLFNYNWVCGNLSTGDGGGVVHLGFIWNGSITNNAILFNQSTNPTLPTNGGGIIVMTTGPDGLNNAGLECGSITDVDCAPGLGDGAGPGLKIDANLIMGNAAESGSGGGIAFQGVNGTEVSRFPNPRAGLGTAANCATQYTATGALNCLWDVVSVTNNIIADNVAGWDGAGVSLTDSLVVNLINNTIVSNDTTASSGVLFNTLGAPLASSTGPTCTANCGTTSAPQPAGLVAIQHSAPLAASLATLSVSCPAGHTGSLTSTGNVTNGACRRFSYPLLANDVIWQNRAFYIGVSTLLGPGTLNQQHTVALFNAFTSTQAATQPTADATLANGAGVIITGGTGACVTPNAAPNYWDIGVRGDTGPTNHSGSTTANRLQPTYTVLTSLGSAATGYQFAGNTAGNPTFISEYCNGSRVPPEFQSLGYQVPPGISDAQVPNPVFNLTPAATVDEGNNWINISWGPLSLVNTSNGSLNATTLGNYGPTAGSSVINRIPLATAAANYNEAPNNDFYGNARKNGFVDAGAVEFAPGGGGAATASVTGGPLAFGNVPPGATSVSRQLVLHNTGSASLTGITLAFSPAQFSRPAGVAGGTCGATLAAASTCTINVVFSPNALGAFSGTLTITASATVSGSPVLLSGTGGAMTLVPASWAPSQTRNCPGTTPAQILACTLDPAQVFTLTNTVNVPLTGIGQGTLGGTAANNYAIARLLSTCGPSGGGQLLGLTTLAPGASCVVTVQFKPLTSQATGVKPATVSVTDAAGTQTASLTGTAN